MMDAVKCAPATPVKKEEIKKTVFLIFEVYRTVIVKMAAPDRAPRKISSSALQLAYTACLASSVHVNISCIVSGNIIKLYIVFYHGISLFLKIRGRGIQYNILFSIQVRKK